MDSLSQMTQKEKQRQVRQQLSALQNWDSEEISPEELRDHHMKKAVRYENEYNHKFVEQVQENIPAAQASSTAPGIIAPTEIPAKESYKEKKERKRKDKEAKKVNPKANHISYDIKESLRYYDSYRNNGFSSLPEDVKKQCEENQIDKDVLRVFSKGYRVNKKGEPEDESDLLDKESDLKFYSDYISGEVSKRKPHLERMVQEVLESPLTVDWFTIPMMKENAGAIKNQIDRLKLFSKVRYDPINASFFDTLSEEEKGLLFIQTQLSAHYERAFKEFLEAYAVDYRTGRYLPKILGKKDKQEGDDKERGIKSTLASLKAKVISSSKEKYGTIKEMYSKRIIKEAHDAPKDRELKDELNLPYYMNEYSVDLLSRCRNLIEQHPEEYARNRKMIDKIYQDAYRYVDLLGDVVLELQVSNTVIINLLLKHEHPTFEEEQMKILSFKENDKIIEQREILHKRISDCTDALSYLVGEKKLSSHAAFYLEKMKSGDVG